MVPFGTGSALNIDAMRQRLIYFYKNDIHDVFPHGERTVDFSLACRLKLVFSAQTSLVD